MYVIFNTYFCIAAGQNPVLPPFPLIYERKYTQNIFQNGYARGESPSIFRSPKRSKSKLQHIFSLF